MGIFYFSLVKYAKARVPRPRRGCQDGGEATAANPAQMSIVLSVVYACAHEHIRTFNRGDVCPTIFKNLLINVRERQGEGETELPPLTSQMPATAGTGLETRNRKHSPGLLCGWQEPSHLCYRCCCPEFAVAGRQSQTLEPEPDVPCRYSDAGCAHLLFFKELFI